MSSQGRASRLTGPGRGAIAVVSLRGPGVAELLQRHFSGTLKPRKARRGVWRRAGAVVDDVLVVLSDDFSAAEVHLHGNPLLVRGVLQDARDAGFEVDDGPGGDFGLLEPADALGREVLEALPAARSWRVAEVLLSQSQAWRDLAKSPTIERLTQVRQDQALRRLLRGVTLAVAGVPNAGKSTVCNRLIGRERSITSPIAGTTRDWVEEWADLDGLPVLLLDTPGVRPTEDPIEAQAIVQSGRAIQSADLVLVLLDPTQDRPTQDALCAKFHEPLRLFTKSDLAKGWDDSIPAVCSLTGQGLDQVRVNLAQRLGLERFKPDVPMCWTDRQLRIVEQAISGIGGLEELFEPLG
jgi:tRNA modification GTPase